MGITNTYLMASRQSLNCTDDGFEDSFPIANRITCKDGFSLSVQANHGAYCRPRRNTGPWLSVELGYPTAKPEFIMSYAEQPDKPTDTVYGYVPVDLVDQLIELHGGIQEA